MEKKITVTYHSLDGGRKTRSYTDTPKGLKAARKFAAEWVGDHPEVYEGSSYAVSGDGIGKITCSGLPVYHLFYDPPTPEPEPQVPTTLRGILKLEREVSEYSISCSETEAEYHGEIARFGDAWPGSAAQVRRGREGLAKMEALLKAAFETPAGQVIVAKREQRRHAFLSDPSNIPF